MRGGLSSMLAVSFGRVTAVLSQLSCIFANWEQNLGLGENGVEGGWGQGGVKNGRDGI